MSEIEISAKAELGRITTQLGALHKQAEKAQKAIEESGKQAGKNLQDNSQRVETHLGKLTQFARRAADQIKGSFERLQTFESLKDLGKVGAPLIKQAVAQTISLNDSLQRIGRTLGLTASEFSSFSTTMTEGLGKIGLGADAGARALDGLAETQVRDKEALLEYSKVAAQLTQLGGEKGQEGGIAKGIAGVVQARGGNVNDGGEARAVAEALRANQNTTGQKPGAALEQMRDLFEGMSVDLRKVFTPRTFAAVNAASASTGPQLMTLFKEFASQDKLGRLPAEMQGLRKAFTANGLDTKYLARWAKGITGRIGFAPESAAQTLGISPEAARGLVLAADRLDKIQAAQDKALNQTGSLGQQAAESLSLMEAAEANINRATSKGAGPLGAGADFANRTLKETAKTDAGAIAATAVGTIMAAGLPSILSRIGGAFGGAGGTAAGVATGKALEKVAGVTPVFVTNWEQMGNKGLAKDIGAAVATGLGPKISALGGIVAAGAGLLGAGAAGYEVGQSIEKTLTDVLPKNKTVEYDGRSVEGLTTLEAGAGQVTKVFESLVRSLTRHAQDIDRLKQLGKSYPGPKATPGNDKGVAFK